MQQQPIELVVLDMAGTTIRDDDAVNDCLRAALSEHGVAATRDEVNQVMGLPKPLAIAMLVEQRTGTQAIDAVVQTIHQNFLERMVDYYHTTENMCPMPFAAETLAALRKSGVKVYLNTGFSRPIVEAILERLQWTGTTVLDGVVASDEVLRGRPHPDMVFRAMELAGVQDAKAVAKVGDTPSDLQEGTAAGCGLVIGVTNGSHTRAQLSPHPHTHLLDSLQPLAELIFSTHQHGKGAAHA